MSASHSRMPLIDALKAFASQAIVLHHLAFYGPLSAGLALAFPGVEEWLSEYARMAVQIFLVISGFLAARHLSPDGEALRNAPYRLIVRRYVRLIVPFLAAMAASIAVAAIVGHWLDDEMVPGPATLPQVLAHASLLYGVLGYESLSAGAWYVAIDFQLFALFALALWLGKKRPVVLLLVGGLTVASLFHFNRDAAWDNWGLYFFGAYGLGAAAWWASSAGRSRLWLGLLAALVVAALLVDFRLRIALALSVALLLGFGRQNGLLEGWPAWRKVMTLGRISYSVFLIHFPVLLLANGLFKLSGSKSPTAAVTVLLLTWLTSTIAGAAFFRWVENPAGRRRAARDNAGRSAELPATPYLARGALSTAD